MWHPHCQTHVVLGLSDEPSTRDVSHLGPGVTWFVCAPWGVPGETHSRPAPLSVAPHHYLYSAPSWVTGWTVLSSCCSRVFGDLPKSQPGSACILAPSQGGCSRPPVLMKRRGLQGTDRCAGTVPQHHPLQVFWVGFSCCCPAVQLPAGLCGIWVAGQRLGVQTRVVLTEQWVGRATTGSYRPFSEFQSLCRADSGRAEEQVVL